jgi:hypothetical protein
MQHEVQQVLKAPDHASKARKGMQALSKQQAGCTTVLLTLSVWHDCINAPMYSQDSSKQSHGMCSSSSPKLSQCQEYGLRIVLWAGRPVGQCESHDTMS